MGNGNSPEGPDLTPSAPQVTAYLYPWDVIGDPGLVPRLSSAGLGHVTLAGAYHSVRAATPQHPQHRFVTAETAALYRPVRASVWAGRRLSPLDAPWTGVDDPLAEAVDALVTGGVRASAWVVLTHNSALGREHRDLVVRNCFGDAYEWALCPANEEVREYAALLATEAVKGLPFEGISIEAWGQLGVEHGSHHDKTADAYSPLSQLILSICCCDACRRAWSVAGLDPQAVVLALRAGLEAARHASRARPEDVLGAPLAAALLATRRASVDSLLDEVLAELSPESTSRRVTLHAQTDPWATGASPGLTPASARRAHSVLVPVQATSPDNGKVTDAARALVANGVNVAAYVSLLGPIERQGLEVRVRAGADELHLYHFGLANEEQLELFSLLASS